MKPTIILTLLIFLTVNIIPAQSIEELVNGPILGTTYAPRAGGFIFRLNLEKIKSDAFWSNNGEKITYYNFTNRSADSEYSSSANF